MLTLFNCAAEVKNNVPKTRGNVRFSRILPGLYPRAKLFKLVFGNKIVVVILPYLSEQCLKNCPNAGMHDLVREGH